MAGIGPLDPDTTSMWETERCELPYTKIRRECTFRPVIHSVRFVLEQNNKLNCTIKSAPIVVDRQSETVDKQGALTAKHGPNTPPLTHPFLVTPLLSPAATTNKA